MRLDKALWFLRFAASRSIAQHWILEGHIRINGRRIEKPSAQIAVGDIMTLPLRIGIVIAQIVTLPARRGPASEAQTCYRVLDERGPMPIAAQEPGPIAGPHPGQEHQGEVPQ